MFDFVVTIEATQMYVLMIAHPSRKRPRPSPTEPPALVIAGAQKASSKVTPSQNPENAVKTTPTNVSPLRKANSPAISSVMKPLAIITAKVTGPTLESTNPALTAPTTPTVTPKLASPSAKGSPMTCAAGPTVGPAMGIWTGRDSAPPEGFCTCVVEFFVSLMRRGPLF